MKLNTFFCPGKCVINFKRFIVNRDHGTVHVNDIIKIQSNLSKFSSYSTHGWSKKPKS